jgi:hypothetical protein
MAALVLTIAALGLPGAEAVELALLVEMALVFLLQVLVA